MEGRKLIEDNYVSYLLLHNKSLWNEEDENIAQVPALTAANEESRKSLSRLGLTEVACEFAAKVC